MREMKSKLLKNNDYQVCWKFSLLSDRMYPSFKWLVHTIKGTVAPFSQWHHLVNTLIEEDKAQELLQDMHKLGIGRSAIIFTFARSMCIPSTEMMEPFLVVM